MPIKRDRIEKTKTGWREVFYSEVHIRKISKMPHMSVKEFKTQNQQKCNCCENDCVHL